MGGYIGESTRSEIDYAEKTGKKIKSISKTLIKTIVHSNKNKTSPTTELLGGRFWGKSFCKTLKISIYQWSWRESNPRPHKETMCFLHAYPGLHFRAVARPGPPTTALSSNLHRCIEAYTDYFRFVCAAKPVRFGTTSPERRLVPSPGDGIKLKIYCASIKQREHTDCCQLIFCLL